MNDSRVVDGRRVRVVEDSARVAMEVVEAVSDRVMVMYFGRVVEQGPAATLFPRPLHPYTRLLLSSAPVPGRSGIGAEPRIAELPDPLAPPPGCAFAARCSYASEVCRSVTPPLEREGETSYACHHPRKDDPWPRVPGPEVPVARPEPRTTA